MSAIGGLIAFIAGIMAVIFGFFEKSTSGFIISVAVFLLAGVAVIYDCGRRIIDTNDRLRGIGHTQGIRNELGALLVKMEAKIHEIQGVQPENWNDKESEINPAGVVVEVSHFLTDHFGKAEFDLMDSQVGQKWTTPNQDFAHTVIQEQATWRQWWIDKLTHHSLHLKRLLEKMG